MNHRKVAVFWDYENCSPPLNSQGHAIVNGIRRIAHVFGYVTSFKAYLDISSQSPKSVGFRSDLQSSGVSMIDCPHNGKKDVVDKMILVDMLAYAVDNPSPATIILIAGDRDYAYAVSTLRLRQYNVVLIVPPAPNIPQSLESQASVVVDWNFAILGKRTETDTSPVRQPYRNLDEDIVERLSREIREFNEDPAVTLISSVPPATSAHMRRISAEELLQPSVFGPNTATSGDATLPALTCTPKKVASSIPEMSERPRFGSVASRTRSATQTVPDIDQGSASPLKENDKLSNESLADNFVSTANENQDATHDPFASTIARLERNPDGSDLPPTISFGNFPPSPVPAVPYKLGLKNPRLASASHTRTISGCTPISYGETPQRVMPPAVPSSPAASRRRNDDVTTPQSANTDFVSAIMDDYVLPSDQAALRNAFQFDDEDEDKDHNSDEEVADSSTSPPPIEVDNRSCAYAVNSAESCSNIGWRTCTTDSPSANGTLSTTQPSVTPMSQMSSSLTLTVSDSNVTSSDVQVEIDSQQPRSVIGDNQDSPSGCQASLVEFVEDKIRGLTPLHFLPMINLLLQARSNGITTPARSVIAVDLLRFDKDIYKRAGVTKFAQYTALAEQASLIELGGREGAAWMALHPNLLRQDVEPHAPESSSTPSTVHRNNSPTPQGNTPYTKTPTPSSPMPSSSTASPRPPTLNPDAQPFMTAVPIPLCFQPLVTCLMKVQKDGIMHPLRSVVGLVLGPAVYSQAGTSSLKEYLAQAVDHGVVECGGTSGNAWVRLHIDVLSGKRSC